MIAGSKNDELFLAEKSLRFLFHKKLHYKVSSLIKTYNHLPGQCKWFDLSNECLQMK